MGKIQFLMDTGGHCFVCLQVAQSDPTGTGTTTMMVTDDGHEQQLDPKIFSFRNLCEYLKINLWEVSNEAMPLNSGSVPVLEKSELKGVLCSGCIPLFEMFSREFLELEEVKMKLTYRLKSIYEKMLAAEKGDERATQKMERERLLRKQTALRNGFVEQLRRKTLERCSTVIETGHPLLMPTQTRVFVEEPTSTSDETQTTSQEVQISGATTPGQMELLLLPEPVPEQVSVEETVVVNGDQQWVEVVGTEEGWTTSYEDLQSQNQTTTDIQEPETVSTLENQEMATDIPKTKQFECSYCSKMFRFSIARNRHMESNCLVRFPAGTIPGEVDQTSTTVTIPEEPTTFECFVCQNTFHMGEQRLHFHGEKRLCHSCHVNFGTDGSLKIRRMKREIIEQENVEEEDDDDDDIAIDIDPDLLRESGLIMITGDRRTATPVGRGRKESSVPPPPRPRSSLATAAVASTSTFDHTASQLPGTEGTPGTSDSDKSISHVPHCPTPSTSSHIPGPSTPSTTNHSANHVPETRSLTPSNSKSLELERGDLSRMSNRFPSRTAKYSQVDLYAMEFACDYCHKTFVLRFQRERHQRFCPAKPKSGLQETPLDISITENDSIEEHDDNQEAPETVEHAAVYISTEELEFIREAEPPSSPNKKSALKVTEILPTNSGVDADRGGHLCKLCDKHFHSKKMMQKHLVSFHRKAKLQCSQCQIKFKSIQGLRRHEQSIHLQKKEQCPSCLKVFSSISNRNMHMRRSCPNNGKEPEPESPTPPEELPVKRKRAAPTPTTPTTSPPKKKDRPPPNIDGPFDEDHELDTEEVKVECQVCQEKVTGAIPAAHKCAYLETTLKFNEVGDVTGEHVTPKLPLLTVNEPISSSQKPQSSVNPKTGDTRCGVCFKEFPRHRVFLNHYMSSHLSMTFNCDICGKEFYYRSDYTRHHREAHVGVRFKCQLCDKIFSQKVRLVEHHQSAHLEQDDGEADEDPDQPQPSTSTQSPAGHNSVRVARSMTPLSTVSSVFKEKIKCSQCPREFKYEMNYQEHYKNVHSKNDDQFKCDHCEREFSDPSQLQRHQETAHPVEVEIEGFSCDICEKVFTQKSNLQVHKQAIHVGKKFNCPKCLKSFSSASSRRKHIRFKRCGKK